jgi:hypothetical protein
LEQDQLGNIVLAGGGVPSTSHRDFCVARIINNTSPLPVELIIYIYSIQQQLPQQQRKYPSSMGNGD